MADAAVTPRIVLPGRESRRRVSHAPVPHIETTEIQSHREPNRMFITIKYADNQSLVCNPMCSIVNLLSNIKDRTGHSEEKDMLLDLSDETGLIQDLETRGRDYATKYLSSHGTYILMQKQVLEEQDDKSSTTQDIQYSYIPLLEQYNELYPNFRVRLSESQLKRLKPLKNFTKSPSPAGKMQTKSSSKGNAQTRPPRSSSRGKPK